MKKFPTKVVVITTGEYKDLSGKELYLEEIVGTRISVNYNMRIIDFKLSEVERFVNEPALLSKREIYIKKSSIEKISELIFPKSENWKIKLQDYLSDFKNEILNEK